MGRFQQRQQQEVERQQQQLLLQLQDQDEGAVEELLAVKWWEMMNATSSLKEV